MNTILEIYLIEWQKCRWGLMILIGVNVHYFVRILFKSLTQ